MPTPEQQYIELLTEKFGLPSDSSDLSQPVSYASNLMGRGMPVLFDLRHLAHVTGVSANVLGLMRHNPSAFYSRFVVRKRSGGSREIAAPTPELKRVQKWINRTIAQRLPMHETAHGFRHGRSIVTNAELHVGADAILAFDLRDFFHMVGRRFVLSRFRDVGYSRLVSRFLTDFVTLDGRLPQGAPTSPALANSAAQQLDRRLEAYSVKHRATYSRYADDLTFSGARSVIHGRRFKRTVEAILRDSGFPPQDAKTRYMDNTERQRVTGLVVNERVNAPRERRRWLRQELYYLERFGLEGHLLRTGSERANYRSYIYGHVVALFASNPREAGDYLTRLDRMVWES